MTNLTSRQGQILYEVIVQGRSPSVSDAALETARETLARMADDLEGSDDPDDRDASLILKGMGVRLSYEQQQRAEDWRAVKVEIEANGHEVYVAYDECAFGRTQGGGWSAFCHCQGEQLGGKYLRTREKAVEIAGRHAAAHGGRWNLDRSD